MPPCKCFYDPARRAGLSNISHSTYSIFSGIWYTALVLSADLVEGNMPPLTCILRHRLPSFGMSPLSVALWIARLSFSRKASLEILSVLSPNRRHSSHVLNSVCLYCPPSIWTC